MDLNPLSSNYLKQLQTSIRICGPNKEQSGDNQVTWCDLRRVVFLFWNHQTCYNSSRDENMYYCNLREHQYNCFRNPQKVKNQVDKKNEWIVKSTKLLFRMGLNTATHLEIILFVQCFFCCLKFLACTKKSWCFWTFKILWLVFALNIWI